MWRLRGERAPGLRCLDDGGKRAAAQSLTEAAVLTSRCSSRPRRTTRGSGSANSPIFLLLLLLLLPSLALRRGGKRAGRRRPKQGRGRAAISKGTPGPRHFHQPALRSGRTPPARGSGAALPSSQRRHWRRRSWRRRRRRWRRRPREGAHFPQGAIRDARDARQVEVPGAFRSRVLHHADVSRRSGRGEHEPGHGLRKHSPVRSTGLGGGGLWA